MDTFQALLKLILDEKSLNDIQAKINSKDFKVKVDIDTSKVKSDVDKMATELNKLSKLNTMQAWADNNSKAIKKYGAELSKLMAEIGKTAADNFKAEIAGGISSAKQSEKPADTVGKENKSIFSKIEGAIDTYKKLSAGLELLQNIENIGGPKCTVSKSYCFEIADNHKCSFGYGSFPMVECENTQGK